MSDHIQIITTAGTRADAETIARALVNERLAACVQLLGPILSTYHWQGSIETNQEWQCMIKTRRDLFEQVEATIRKLHPYEVPEILALPVVAANRSYLDWIDAEVIRPQ
jgi:periplasmic divalent cation tolerance protein